MKHAKYLFLLLIVISVSLWGCKKTDSPKSKTGYLTQKPWVLIGEKKKTVTGSTETEWLDVFKDRQPCNLDNTYMYTVSGEYIADQGASKCSDADPQTFKSRWAWQPSVDNVDFFEYATGDVRMVVQLDDQILTIESRVYSAGYGTYSRLTFTHP